MVFGSCPVRRRAEIYPENKPKIFPIHGWSGAWLNATEPGARRERTRRPNRDPLLAKHSKVAVRVSRALQRDFRGGQALNLPHVLGTFVECHEVVIR
jgi:hypothetical protein